MTPKGLVEARVGNLTFSTGSCEALLPMIIARLSEPSRKACLIGYLNPHTYNWAMRDTETRRFYDRCEAVLVDGVGISLAALLFGHRLPRLPMVHLFDLLLDIPTVRGEAVLIGGSTDRAASAAAAMNARSKGIRIVCALDGFRDLTEYETLLAPYREVDFLLVGAGTPRSEYLLLRATEYCPGAVCISVGGGTIDYYAGAKRRPPHWAQAAGVQWLYRMIREPQTRPRYLRGGLEFAGHLLAAYSAARSQSG